MNTTYTRPTSTAETHTETYKTTFSGFSIGELEWFKFGVSVGYLALAIGSFLAMSFFITHNMVGTNKPLWDSVNGFNWTIGQNLYLLISLGFAFGFNAFTWFFYQVEQSVRNRAFILAVAVLFPMFCEVGQSMTRAEETRHESATESETFKTMQKRVENAGASKDTGLASLIADSEADKAKAQTALEQCWTKYKGEVSQGQCKRKQEQAIAQAQGRIQSLRQSGIEQINTTSQQLAKDSQTLKDLEHDTTFLQPIVRLLMGLGFPALLASFTIALVIIGSIEVAMSYLGGLLRQIKETLRAKGVEPTPKQAVFQSPFVSALHSTGEVLAGEMAKAQYAQEQLRRKITGESPRPPLSVPPTMKPKQEAPKPAPAPVPPAPVEPVVQVQPEPPASKTEEPKALSQKEAIRILVRLVTYNRDSSTPFTLNEIKRAYAVAKTFEAMPVMDLEKITLAFNNLQQAKNATRTNTDKLHGQSESIRVNTDTEAETVRVYTRTNTDTHTEEKTDYTDKIQQYELVKNSPVGTVCGCPWCGEKFTKKTYNHRFCVSSHKDEFWNAVKPERLEAKEAREKRKKAKT